MKERYTHTHTHTHTLGERTSERGGVFVVERERECFVFLSLGFSVGHILVSFSLQMVFFCILEP